MDEDYASLLLFLTNFEPTLHKVFGGLLLQGDVIM
jgi:hypothetical protein